MPARRLGVVRLNDVSATDPGSTGRLNVREVLRRGDQPVEIVRVDDRRHPMPATGQVHRLVIDPRRIDDVRQPRPSNR